MNPFSNNLRNPGIDIIKTLAVILVVSLHVQMMSFNIDDDTSFGFKLYLWELLGHISLTCIPFFGMMSGYLLIYQDLKYNKLLTIWLMVIFYSVLAELFGVFYYHEAFSWAETLMPILHRRWWYVTAYFVLFLFIPILNRALKDTSPRRCLNWSILILLFCCRNPFSHNLDDIFASKFSVLNLIWLYIIGATIRRLQTAENEYSFLFNAKGQKYVWGGIVFAYLIIVALPHYLSFPKPSTYTFLIDHFYAPFNLAITILTILFFVKHPCGMFGKICSKIAPYSLDIYVIHMHPRLWYPVFRFGGVISLVQNSLPQFVFLTLVRITVIIFACLVIAHTRNIIFQVLSNLCHRFGAR